MTVFDWTRTRIDLPMPDGSTTLSYDHDELSRINLSCVGKSLPAWATSYSARQIDELFDAYTQVDEERL